MDVLFFYTLPIFACLLVIVVTTTFMALEASGQSEIQDSYSCTRFTSTCNIQTNNFNSIETVGHTQAIQAINSSRFEPVEGVFGDALAVNGFRQQHFTVPNKKELNPEIFSVSFWAKQDSAFIANSAIISHVNAKKNAGWSFQLNVSKSQKSMQFSVVNTDGKIFAVTSPFVTGIFQNFIGVFNGKQVKIYLNGLLINSTQFHGKYEPDPGVPLNVGINSFDAGGSWTGEIDELRLYNIAIDGENLQRLSDYDSYYRLSNSSSRESGLISYWPFNGVTADRSGNHNDGSIILPTVSLVFSPDGRLFFSVMDAGEIRIMQNDKVLHEPFVTLRDSENTYQEVLGITLDPNFSTNHYVYAYIAAIDNTTDTSINRVLRFTETENKATDPKIIVNNIPAGRPPNYAGAVTFGPDEKLYVTTGYASQIDDHLNRNLTGKVLRINRDGTIPSDNPFQNSPVYTLGHRGMFGIAFDKKTVAAIVSENDVRNRDEINILAKGGNYGFPSPQPSSGGKYVTDNATGIKSARTYYKSMTPTQAIFYDGNKFPSLRGKFLVASFGERSIYALTVNGTGHVTEELAIRLPDLGGHIIAIANAPNGDIYLGGENIYKLISLDSGRSIMTYFVDVTKGNNLKINDLSVNLTSKVLSLDITNGNNETSTNKSLPSLSLQVKVPKALLGGIYDVTSDKYNKSSNASEKAVEKFRLKETRRVSNVGETIVDIDLNNNSIHNDKIMIKGQTSTLAQLASRRIAIYR